MINGQQIRRGAFAGLSFLCGLLVGLYFSQVSCFVPTSRERVEGRFHKIADYFNIEYEQTGKTPPSDWRFRDGRGGWITWTKNGSRVKLVSHTQGIEVGDDYEYTFTLSVTHMNGYQNP